MISSIEIASLQQILLGSHENSHVDTEALDTSSFNIGTRKSAIDFRKVHSIVSPEYLLSQGSIAVDSKSL